MTMRKNKIFGTKTAKIERFQNVSLMLKCCVCFLFAVLFKKDSKGR